MCQCACCGHQETRRRGFRPIALLFNMTIAWLVLVVGGGTLINTGHPVASEAGRLIQTVTLVEPAAHWVESRGFRPMANGLRLLSHGIPVSWRG